MTPVTSKLIDCIKNLSSAAIDRLLAMAHEMVNTETITISSCPCCGSSHIVRNGKKRGKQRFLCKSCCQTFVTTMHTVMSMSHYPAAVWKEVIADTLGGNAIDYTVKHRDLSHQCVFNMRQKILLAMQYIAYSDPVMLGQVS